VPRERTPSREGALSAGRAGFPWCDVEVRVPAHEIAGRAGAARAIGLCASAYCGTRQAIPYFFIFRATVDWSMPSACAMRVWFP
jgi:hypothetical protein